MEKEGRSTKTLGRPGTPDPRQCDEDAVSYDPNPVEEPTKKRMPNKKTQVETFEYPKAPTFFRKRFLKYRTEVRQRPLTPVETHYTLSLANRLFMLGPKIYWTLRNNQIVYILADRFYTASYSVHFSISIRESVDLSNSLILWHCKDPSKLFKLAQILCGCLEGPECTDAGTEGLCHHLKSGLDLQSGRSSPSSNASTSDIQDVRSLHIQEPNNPHEDDSDSYTTLDDSESVLSVSDSDQP